MTNTQSDTVSVVNTTTNKVYKNNAVGSAPYEIDIDKGANKS